MKKEQDLIQNLKRIFKDRFVLENYLNGVNYCLFDGEAITLSYTDDNIILSGLPGDQIILNRLSLAINSLFGSNPVAAYDIVSYGIAMPTIEWDTKPLVAMWEIVNNYNVAKETTKRNIRLFNGYEPKDFDCVSKHQIFGEFMGPLQFEENLKLDEINTFWLIYFYSQKLMENKGLVSENTTLLDGYALEYLMYKTKDFGVEIPDAKPGEHILPNDSFKSWYEYYSNWFLIVLTKRELSEFFDKRNNGEDVSQYLPEEKWSDINQKRKREKQSDKS